MARAARQHLLGSSPRHDVGQRRVILGVPIRREVQIPDLGQRERGVAVRHVPRDAIIGRWLQTRRVDRIRPRRRRLAPQCRAFDCEQKSHDCSDCCIGRSCAYPVLHRLLCLRFALRMRSPAPPPQLPLFTSGCATLANSRRLPTGSSPESTDWRFRHELRRDPKARVTLRGKAASGSLKSRP